jgi:hypothetical protein
MKRFVVPAASLAVVAALICGRSFLATAQQSIPVLPPSPAITSYVPAPSPAVPASKELSASSLAELVQMLKTVRQQKSELQFMEEKIATTIRQKIEEEKKLHEKVQQLLDNPEEGSTTINSRT